MPAELRMKIYLWIPAESLNVACKNFAGEAAPPRPSLPASRIRGEPNGLDSEEKNHEREIPFGSSGFLPLFVRCGRSARTPESSVEAPEAGKRLFPPNWQDGISLWKRIGPETNVP
jgi:hypothetical protein